MDPSLALLEEKVFRLIERCEELRRQLREKDSELAEARRSLAAAEEEQRKDKLRMKKILDTLENLGV
jgi:septal ring factor EnvC (AmiA/AmiB activator)